MSLETFLLGSLLHSVAAESGDDNNAGGIYLSTIFVVLLVIGVILFLVRRSSSEPNYGRVSSANFGMKKNQSD
ncbi:hypothetical protein Bpfe_024339 [Biomphalaria pfeifferi]|uniref:Uncharacterized protein n=1 Tax=Biomphalaria pfeifferi TaxID=112525 RepID=A0AAD8B1D5_BIOPF|nr:hypothetical protein Bpfe_024339 [Biomphalaria pfeifferi]